jgi:amino acid adenylation domain-containing protein
VEDQVTRSRGSEDDSTTALSAAPREPNDSRESTLSAEELRAHVAATLPEHMVPAAYVRLDALPLTPNGKLDRKALPSPDDDAYVTRGYEAPQGETETALSELWSEVLKVERVGRHDNFFELGGHSLLAVTLIERMRRRDLHADVRTLFATPSLAELAATLGGAAVRRIEVPANAIPAGCTAIAPDMLPLVSLQQEDLDRIVAGVPGGAANIQDIYPLAPLQEGILFHHLMAKSGDTYLLARLSAFDTREALDAHLAALQAVIDRHDILRTSVAWEGLPEPVQVVWRKAELPVQEVTLDAGAGDAAAQLYERFDPRHTGIDLRRAPLLRAFIARDERQGRWLFLFLLHHLAGDHLTVEGIRAEVEAHLAGAAERLEEALPFRNYVAQARLGVSREEHEAFFRKMLGDVEGPTAPFGLLDVQGDGSAIAEARVRLDEGLAGALRDRARKLGVSVASLCHLAWAQVLARVTGRDDVVFGTVLFGRMEGGAGADRVLGLFINTLPLRIHVGDEPVDAAVRRTHILLADLLRHEHASLALAQRCSGVPAPAPLFSSLLNYRHSPQAASNAETATIRTREGMRGIYTEERTNYPLTLSVDDLGNELYLTAQVHDSIEPRRVCALMRTALATLVEALETSPARPVRSLDILPEAERRQVAETWNATDADYPRDTCLHRLFEEQVRRTPEATAIEHGDRSLSYGELNGRANGLAQLLRAAGTQPGERVAIAMPRSIELVVAELAILKCGAAYVPVDPTFPAERLAFLVADSAAGIILSRRGEELPDLPARRIDVDGSIAESTENPALSLTSEVPAYVMYTSGSTGQPKGVVVPHRAVARLVLNNGYARFEPADRVAFAANPAFDATTMEVWAPLLNGGRIVVIDQEALLEAGRFGQTLERHAVNVLWLTVGLFNHYATELGEELRRLRYLIVGGDALDPRIIGRFLAGGSPEHLLNGYGPTETTTFAITHEITAVAEGARSIPLGRPISNTRIYILDVHGRPAPVGVGGEIHIGGEGVALGYLNRPELTAERFVPDPFSSETGARMYRTGDLGRWLPDGTIEFLGRNDEQVKIRGYRIELGEIEARLGAHSGVREAVVIAREEGAGDKRLVAYYVADDEVTRRRGERGAEDGSISSNSAAPRETDDFRAGTLTAEELHAQLAVSLPEYMVPAAYVRLDALPLTPNGKLDRKALPAPEGDAYVTRGYEAPIGEIEQALAEIWAVVLKVERVGRYDNFFELGGHSLLAVSLVGRMRQRGLHVDMQALFSTSSLAELAAAVGGTAADVDVPANRMAAGCEQITPGMLPLVALQQEEIDRIVAAVPGGARNVQDIYPLAPLQEGILFHHRMAEKGDTYLLASLLAFDTRERLDAFVAALQAVIDRHDVLRTAVLWEGLPEPLQVVLRHTTLPVDEVILEGTPADAAGQLYERFDPRHSRIDVRQAPLLRAATAYDAANDRWLLLLLLHHLAGDHATMDLIRAEVEALLRNRADELPAPLPFRDYVARTRLGVSREEQEAFFRDMLADIDEPTAPFGLLDVQGDGAGIAEAALMLDPALAARLRRRARKLGVSAATLCHLAWAQVLARVTGRDDVVFGTVLLGRMQGGEGVDRVMGLFINTLPLRIRIAGEGVEAAVLATHALLAGLMRHEHASLTLAQRCSGVAAPAPLFSSLLNYRHHSGDGRSAPRFEGMRGLRSEERTNYPLTLSVDDLGDGFRLLAQVHRSVEPQRVCALMRTALEQLVEALETRPATPVRSLDVLPAEERRQVIETWNATDVDYPRETCLHELFEAQVERTPDAMAVVDERQSLTYAELNARANRLAHELRNRGVEPDARVAVCAERSVELVVGLLAVLKAGGAYVPLDPSYPADRLRAMLDDSAPVALLVDRAGEQACGPQSPGDEDPSADSGARSPIVIDLEGASTRALSESGGKPPHSKAALRAAEEFERNLDRGGLTSRNLAYVIYTSGSTGMPKGAMNEHRAVVNRLLWMQEAYGLGAADRVLQKTPFSFDVSVWEFYWPLLTGAGLVMARPEGHKDPAYLVETIRKGSITTLHFVPSMLPLFLADRDVPACTSLLRVICSGEALPAAVVRRFHEVLPDVELHNLYGPTEAAVDVTAWACLPGYTGTSIPIGRPIANTRIYLLDEQRRPAPIGVAGELHIAGVQVGRGYLNRPELTAERFIADPFSNEADARMYRTGDLARWLPDGNVEYLGRNDFQVKLRGFRIELGEIEARLTAHPDIREAVVVAREDAAGDQRLVAYYVADDEGTRSRGAR